MPNNDILQHFLSFMV